MKKFIRAVALANFRPDGMSEEEQIKLFEEEKPILRARHDTNNSVDDTAIALFWGTKQVAYVNVDDKRWIKPLLDNSKTRGVKLTFDHTVHSTKGEHTILKYVVEVDKKIVDDVRASNVWDNFKYSHPLIEMTGEQGILEEASYVLLSILNGEDDFEDITLQECVADICKECRYDMSIETTNLINECCIALEEENTPESIFLMEQLEEASTHRRSRNSIKEWAEWFENIVKSERATHLYKMNLFYLRKKLDRSRISKKMLESDLECLEKELLGIPQMLGADIDNPGRFFQKLFYTNITRPKLHELLSALILRRLIRQVLDIEIDPEGALVVDRETSEIHLKADWLCEWAKASNDKTVISVISQALMAYSVKENDEELYRQVGDLMSSCGEKKVEISVGNAGQVIANVEHLNNK